MHLHPVRSSLLIIGAIAALSVPSLAALNRQELLQQGEDYVIALHDTYLEAANALKGGRHPEIPRYFLARAKAIEAGDEIFPANPKEFPIADEKMSARLEWAYEETFDVVTSEAGDVEPYLTAHVQTAYEQWLITMHIDPKDQDAEKLATAFDKRLDALTASPAVSLLEPGTTGRTVTKTETALGIALPQRAPPGRRI